MINLIPVLLFGFLLSTPVDKVIHNTSFIFLDNKLPIDINLNDFELSINL